MPCRHSPSLYVVHPDIELTKTWDRGFPVVVRAVVCNVVTCPQSTVNSWVLAELEKEMATHPVFLPGKSHGQRSLVGDTPSALKSWTQLNNSN